MRTFPDAYRLLLSGVSLGLLFSPEHGSNVFFQTVCRLLPNYTEIHPIQHYLKITLRTFNIEHLHYEI
jgi:hypothetical protein